MLFADQSAGRNTSRDGAAMLFFSGWSYPEICPANRGMHEWRLDMSRNGEMTGIWPFYDFGVGLVQSHATY